MRGLVLSTFWLLCGSTDDDPKWHNQNADQHQHYHPHSNPFGGYYAEPPPIVKPNSAALLLGFSVVVMLLNRFGNQLGRFNLLAQLTQLGMISLPIFSQITGFSGKAVLIRLTQSIPGMADLYSWPCK